MKIMLMMLLGLSLLSGICEASEVIVDMDRIMMIESGGRAEAYNPKSKATGLYQVTPIALADFNSLNNEHYSLKDMRNPQKCGRVAYWMMEKRIPDLLMHFRLQDDVRHRIWAYNAGIKAVIDKRMPLETRLYLEKYEAMGG